MIATEDYIEIWLMDSDMTKSIFSCPLERVHRALKKKSPTRWKKFCWELSSAVGELQWKKTEIKAEKHVSPRCCGDNHRQRRHPLTGISCLKKAPGVPAAAQRVKSSTGAAQVTEEVSGAILSLVQCVKGPAVLQPLLIKKVEQHPSPGTWWVTFPCNFRFLPFGWRIKEGQRISQLKREEMLDRSQKSREAFGIPPRHGSSDAKVCFMHKEQKERRTA